MTQITQGPIGPALPTTATSPSVGAGQSALGKDDFLNLLVTQLKNQDPLNPQDSTAFVAQLAQFSSLESMQNIQGLLTNQGTDTALNTLASKANLATSMIGRNVLAVGNQLEVTQAGSGSVDIDVGGAGGSFTLNVMDSSGRIVASEETGFLAAGRQTLATGTLPAGKYTYSVTSADGSTPVTTYTSGVVNGVSFQNGTVVLRAGTLTFPLDNVIEVGAAPAGAAAIAALASARITSSSTE
jgi:flagellar basal-body rod modification protein FlgD